MQSHLSIRTATHSSQHPDQQTPVTSADEDISPTQVNRHDFAPSDSLTIPNSTLSSNVQSQCQALHSLPPVDTSAHSSIPTFHVRHPSITPTRSPLTAAGLHIDTDIQRNTLQPILSNDSQPPNSAEYMHSPSSPLSGHPGAVPVRGSYMRTSLSAASMHSNRSSPGSVVSSPMLAAMTDLTPLPSPFVENEIPGGPWAMAMHKRNESAGSLSSIREEILPENIQDSSISAPSKTSPTKAKRKSYGSLISQAMEASSVNAAMQKNAMAHARNRSQSEFVPEELHNIRPRNITLTGAPVMETLPGNAPGLHREAYLAEQRGLVANSQPPRSLQAPLPTPPESNRSATGSDCAETQEEDTHVEYLTVRTGKRKRQYRPVRPLGQGTFSKVVLATDDPSIPSKTILNEASEPQLNPKHLVAIKIVEHGPAGGADEERVELSLKREVALLKAVSHPSIIQLKAFDFDEREALLVLSYCSGGDLFDLANGKQHLLTPSVVQRIFAELVDAVKYLHDQYIVHRDLKLENILLNLSPEEISAQNMPDARRFPHPLITLTDLGLSRHVPKPPESPLLTTRCGSEDYAAPEILLAQPYDGRQTDAWALGVVLYALMEWRLPFDAPPVRPGQRVARGRSKAAHRIARCEWMWCRFGDDDGEWDASQDPGNDWTGASEIVKNLLKKVSRGRWSIDRLKETDYVENGILTADGGISKVYDLNASGDREDVDMRDARDEEDTICGAEARANQMEVTKDDDDE